MAAPRPPVGRRRCVALPLAGLLLLTGSAGHVHAAPGVAAAPPVDPAPALPVAAAPPVPEALVGPEIDLRQGPVAVPLQLELPTLGTRAPVVGVGLTSANVMDAPMGPAGDPAWEQVFWYRGSAVPGAASTATLAGHVAGPGGDAVFADLGELAPGDPVIVHDTRTGLAVRFAVTGSVRHPLSATRDPAVLTEMYGAGPVAGTGPQPSADGLAHLTMVTCTGTFRDGTHDHRLVVTATRTA